MYAQKINGIWTELNGNIVFSDSVYQTAESLTDEQRAQFGVYKIKNLPKQDIAPFQKYAEAVFVFENEELIRSWPIVDKTVEEIEAERKASIPSYVTMRQGRLAMLNTPYSDGNLLDVIESMLDSIVDPAQKLAARIDWEYAQEIRRDFPLVQQLTAQLGLTERQIDDLFVLAATL